MMTLKALAMDGCAYLFVCLSVCLSVIFVWHFSIMSTFEANETYMKIRTTCRMWRERHAMLTLDCRRLVTIGRCSWHTSGTAVRWTAAVWRRRQPGTTAPTVWQSTRSKSSLSATFSSISSLV